MVTEQIPNNGAPTASGLTQEEEAALYAKKRRFATIFGWLLAGVVLVIFVSTMMVLAERGGPNPMIEPTEQFTEE